MKPGISRKFDEDARLRIKRLRSFRSGSHVHILGICGTGMASLLVLLKEKGFRVTGTDKAFYPPMGDIVREHADTVYEGYSAENINQRPDLVLVGNVISADNPEVVAVHRKNIPFASMPEALAAFLIGPRELTAHSVVVSGTHGKTTTTALTAWLLESSGMQPGFFIGGAPLNFSSGIRPAATKRSARDRVVVLEGDEYDSAYFSKYSKFQAYRPDVAVVTSLEFDHADIFPNLEAIEEQFRRFLIRVPENGLILCADTAGVNSFLKKFEPEFPAELRLYGKSSRCSYRISSLAQESAKVDGKLQRSQRMRVVTPLAPEGIELSLPLSGEHNAYNAAAAFAVAEWLGCDQQEASSGLRAFRGVERRQQLLYEASGIMLLEDFAHHPTAVDTTLRGLKQAFNPKRLIAVLEPRSNTSRSAVFQDRYKEALGQADEAIVAEPHFDAGSFRGEINTHLDTQRLASELSAEGTPALSFKSTEEIQAYLLSHLREGDLAVLMSNGSFGGLASSLPAALKQRD